VKRASVKKNGVIAYSATLPDEEMAVWIETHKESWGRSAYQELVTPEILEVKDEAGNIITPGASAVYRIVPADYELEVVDIKKELQDAQAQAELNSQKRQAARALIKNTDRSKLTTVASLKTLLLAIVDLLEE
jgi:hypothetical protein